MGNPWGFDFLFGTIADDDGRYWQRSRTDCKPRANYLLFRGLEGGFSGPY
jgi:hypothetical protein